MDIHRSMNIYGHPLISMVIPWISIDSMESLESAWNKFGEWGGVGYEIDGKTSTIPPFSAEGYSAAKPIYIEMPGWKRSTIGTHSFDELPQEAKNYIRKIEELSQIPVDILSTGPDRDETLILRNPFD